MTHLNGSTAIAQLACQLLSQAHLLLVAGNRGAAQLNPAQTVRLAEWMAEIVRSVILHCDSRNLPADQPVGPDLPGRMDHAATRLRLAQELLEDLVAPGRPAAGHPLLGAVEDAAHQMDLAWSLTNDIGGYQHAQQVYEVSRNLTGIVRALAEIAEATGSAVGGAWAEATKRLTLGFHAVHAIGSNP